MEKIRFSIVIPAYNTEKYIERCIKSILGQNYSNLQIIVVNDGSSDTTEAIVRKMAAVYSEICLVSQENKGAAAARNKGVKFVDGDYFMYVDSDDYIQKGCLREIEKHLIDEEYDILSFNLLTARENGKINTIQEINEKYRGKHCAMKEKELLKVPTLPVCKFYRSKWYKENEFLFPEGLLYEDVPLVPFMIAKASSIYIIDTPYYVYLQRENSTMHRAIDSKMLDIIKAMRYCKKLFLNANMYSYYYEEIEYIAVCTVFFQITEMINVIDKNSLLQKELTKFIRKNYPNAYNNKYLSRKQSKRAKLLYDGNYKRYYRKYAIERIVRNKLQNFLPAHLYYIFSKMKKGC